jgi:BRCA1/BRCA2-containing complex subunit 3
MASVAETGLVVLNADVYFACLAHAFSTEREEIMGLLIGEVVDNGGGEGSYGRDRSACVAISNLVVLSRVDKRKDRCEISPQQLVEASSRAEVRGTDVFTFCICMFSELCTFE